VSFYKSYWHEIVPIAFINRHIIAGCLDKKDAGAD